MSDKRTVGIIGGMGPAATALLFEKVVAYTDAACDAEHIHILIDNYPQIPDRTAAILAGSDAPVDFICEAAQRLCTAGAELLAIPCNTSHYFYDAIQERVPISIIHMARETAAAVVARGYRSVGILATSGTCGTRVYDAALADVGVAAVYPSDDGQAAVMRLIYEEVKAGKPANTERLRPYLEEMASRGAQVFILGCTELPIALHDGDFGYRFIDTLDVLARAVVTQAGYRLKEESRG